MNRMKTIELLGEVDGQHRLSAQVPSEIPPGPVKFALIVPSGETNSTGEDEAGLVWMTGVSREWHEDLADERQDIYTLNDGEPVDEAR
jgi:hypothetical protein